MSFRKPTTPVLNTNHPLATNLQVAWLINEGSGTSIADYSVNNHTGEILDGGTWVTGDYGAMVRLDGTNDRIRNVSDSYTGTGTNARTVMFLINNRTTSGINVVGSLGNPAYRFGFYSNGTALNFWNSDGSGDTNLLASGWTTGYHTLIATKPSTASGGKAYVDGSSFNLNNYVGSTGDGLIAGVPDADIGNDWHPEVDIVAVMVWSRELTAAEVAVLNVDPFIMFRTPRKLLPLGDSITDGDNDTFGYRDHLQDDLASNEFDFVGALSSPATSTTHDVHNAGVTGERTDEIESRTQAALDYYMEGVSAGSCVLLHAGTNDCVQNYGGGTSAWVDNVEDIIDIIHAHDPDIDVYVAQIVPSKNSTVNSRITSFNSALATKIGTMQGSKSNLYLVDMYTAFTNNGSWDTAYMYDDYHPNDAGYQVMATTWYNAMLPNIAKFIMSASANITDGGATTAQLTAPSGKTSGADFQAGEILDVTNGATLDLGDSKYTEIEWSIEATSSADAATTYEFRVTKGGTVLDTYTATPEWSIPAVVASKNLTLLGVG